MRLRSVSDVSCRRPGVFALTDSAQKRRVFGSSERTDLEWRYVAHSSSGIDALVGAIKRAADGSEASSAADTDAEAAGSSALIDLTPRQRDVLGLMAEGLDNSAIGDVLELSRKSVETYVNGVYHGLNV